MYETKKLEYMFGGQKKNKYCVSLNDKPLDVYNSDCFLQHCILTAISTFLFMQLSFISTRPSSYLRKPLVLFGPR